MIDPFPLSPGTDLMWQFPTSVLAVESSSAEAGRARDGGSGDAEGAACRAPRCLGSVRSLPVHMRVSQRPESPASAVFCRTSLMGMC